LKHLSVALFNKNTNVMLLILEESNLPLENLLGCEKIFQKFFGAKNGRRSVWSEEVDE